MRPYRPYGAAEKLLYCQDPEVLLEGPAGTGKSRGCLEKLYICAMKYAGMRAAIARQTRVAATETALVTFEDKVVPVGSPILSDVTRQGRHSYKFPNGSEIVVAGFDNMEKYMSGEFDMIYVQEAIELRQDSWEKATTRLRNGVMPYQQLIADTNPDVPTHWLKLRCSEGVTTSFLSRHEDNPLLFDHEKGEWTEAGRVYIEKLDALTGVRKQRLRYGLWVAAEGLIWEEYDPAVHLVDALPAGSEHWPRTWVIDFGFTNPFVWQEWAEDPDGRLWRDQEIYKTRTLVEDHAKEIMRHAKGKPVQIICDHDAEDRATLERHLPPGYVTIPAAKGVSDGIQEVSERLRVAGDGKPRLFLRRNARVHKADEHLAESKLPTCTEEEIVGYVWDTSSNKAPKETPLKMNDHGCDCIRYRCNTKPQVLEMNFY